MYKKNIVFFPARKFHTRGKGALKDSLFVYTEFVGRVFKILVPHPYIDQKI